MTRNVNPKSDTFILVSVHGMKLLLLSVFAENEQGLYQFLSLFSIMLLRCCRPQIYSTFVVPSNSFLVRIP